MGDSDKPHVGAESIEAGLRAVFGRTRADPESVPGRLGLDSVTLRDDAGDDAAPRADAGDAIGDRRYDVVGEIARGGVGIVLESRDRDLSRHVALKVLRPEYASDPGVLARFVEEAQVGGQLQHPGIVPVYGLGLQPDGRPYFAMKLVRGRTLAAILEARAGPAENRRRLLGIFEQVCQTLAYAHARGVIHRDLKPSNVMVGPFGEVQVVDWGFAKVLGAEEREPAAPARESGPGETIVTTVRTGDGSSHSIAGSVLGTPAYMPPEQATGRVNDIDERADVFALGGILCEILTGAPPYAGTPGEMLTMAATGELEDAWRRLDDCDAARDLTDLARRCLQARRDERPRDAAAVAAAVQEQLAAEEERARRLEVAAAEERAKEVEEQARLAREVAQAKEEEARVAKEKREAERERARQREERERADFERKARTRWLAVAATLLVAVVVGVGGLLRSEAEASARAQDVAARVDAALRQAGDHEYRGEWSEAVAAAKAALNVARDADDETRTHARSAVERLEARDREEREAALRREQDEELLQGWLRAVREIGYGENDANLIDLLRRHGIDVAKPEEAAARVRASERSAEIGHVLDTWAWFRKTRPELAGLDWKVLVRIARDGDPDPLRNRVRAAAAAADVDALPALMAEVDAPGTPAVTRVLLGFSLYDFGRHLDAIEVLRKAVRAHPASKEAHTWLGMVLNTLKPPRTTEAARHAAAMAALRPGNELARLFASFLAGDYPTAVRICESVLARDPDNALARMELASALWHMRDWPRAIPALRRALDASPKNTYAWLTLADALYRSGDLPGALNVARESESVLPPSPQVRAFQLGALSLYFARTGQHDKGIEKAREAVQAAPDVALARQVLGQVLRWSGRADAAIDALRNSLELEPSADAHGELGFLLREDDPAAALAHLRQAIALDPGRAALHARLAEFRLRQRGDPDRALLDANRALRLDGNDARAWTVLADAHRVRGEFDRYERYARQIHDLNPRSAASCAHRSRIAARRGDREAALRWARQALDQPDAAPGDRALVALARMRLGRFAKALADLRACRDRAPAKGTDDEYDARFRERLADWTGICERAAPIAARRDAIVRGEDAPANPDERRAHADLCYFVGAYARAAALYRGEDAPADRRARERAAFAAAQGGPEDRAAALALLRREFEASKQTDDVAAARHALWAWKREPLLAPVRDPIPLAKLPDAERAGWVPFWNDVETLLDRLRESE